MRQLQEDRGGSLLQLLVSNANDGGRRDAPPTASALGHRWSDATRNPGLNLWRGPPAVNVAMTLVRTQVSM
jgi:hypothetical protein